VIKVPEVRRKRRFKTESGYKLRGAMVWVVLGIIAGAAAALIAFGLTLAANELSHQLDMVFGSCADRTVFDDVSDGLTGCAIFAAIAILLFLSRKSIARKTTAKYAEFSNDIGGWFSFGAMMTYAVCGLPLAAVAVFGNSCQ
jgi:hypothetical protein